jgi:hypothetical protein
MVQNILDITRPCGDRDRPWLSRARVHWASVACLLLLSRFLALWRRASAMSMVPVRHKMVRLRWPALT